VLHPGLIIYGVGGIWRCWRRGCPLLTRVLGFEGGGSALMNPPIYILVTVAFPA